MSNKNVGPAFPSTITNRSEIPLTGVCGEQIMPNKFSAYPGLSIRDYFAAKAMQSLTQVYWDTQDQYPGGDELIKCQAETAYQMADAMLAERAK